MRLGLMLGALASLVLGLGWIVLSWGGHALGVLAYLATSAGLFLFGVHAWVLLAQRRRNAASYVSRLARVHALAESVRSREPTVLVQVPVFEEPAVVARVIDAVARLDYPRDRLAIQVLDDSRDETTALVDAAVARHAAAGLPIETLRREHRLGFKAGALSAGLQHADATYVAIFDADFVPEPDFLRRALPLFEYGPRVACVQGRWGHLNRRQNLLTRAQAVGVDAHFEVQQLARAASGRFLNFNGTAGIWRVEAIHDAGGWRGDTITEDLDLSYRAQLRGWQIVFDPELEVRGELPPTLDAYKRQQRRWACGSTQCARRFLGAVWRSELSLGAKLEASAHLGGYAVSLAMVALVVLMPWAVTQFPMLSQQGWLWPVWFLVWGAALGPIAMAAVGQRGRGLSAFADVGLAVLLGLGSCANNALAVVRGLTRPIRVFHRTPKQGAQQGRVQAAAPRMELVMALATLLALLLLPGERPWGRAAYAVTACLGFAALAVYGWVVERRRAGPR